MPDPSAPAPSKRASTSSKRQSTLSANTQSTPSAPKPPCTIDPGATIAALATLSGTHPVTIGPRTVLHPYSAVSALAGLVNIADGVIVWERASVGVGTGSGSATVIESNVVLETGSSVGAGAKVGEGSLVECLAKVGAGAVVGKFCKIVPYAIVPAGAVIPDFTVVYGAGARRRIDTTTRDRGVVADMRMAAHHKQLKGLQALIPSNIAKWQSRIDDDRSDAKLARP